MPIRDFASTDAGGWRVVNGDFAAVSDQEAVLQGIRIRLRMFFGECWLNEALGLPYIEQILVKNPDPLLVRELLRAAIAATPDVTDVVGVLPTIAPDRRSVVNFAVASLYSTETTISTVEI